MHPALEEQTARLKTFTPDRIQEIVDGVWAKSGMKSPINKKRGKTLYTPIGRVFIDKEGYINLPPELRGRKMYGPETDKLGTRLKDWLFSPLVEKLTNEAKAGINISDTYVWRVCWDNVAKQDQSIKLNKAVSDLAYSYRGIESRIAKGFAKKIYQVASGQPGRIIEIDTWRFLKPLVDPRLCTIIFKTTGRPPIWSDYAITAHYRDAFIEVDDTSKNLLPILLELVRLKYARTHLPPSTGRDTLKGLKKFLCDHGLTPQGWRFLAQASIVTNREIARSLPGFLARQNNLPAVIAVNGFGATISNIAKYAKNAPTSTISFLLGQAFVLLGSDTSMSWQPSMEAFKPINPAAASFVVAISTQSRKIARRKKGGLKDFLHNITNETDFLFERIIWLQEDQATLHLDRNQIKAARQWSWWTEQARRWHMQKYNVPKGLTWPPALSTSTEHGKYRFEEICTGEGLYEEGDAMRHCVASYTQRCASGISHIFSIKDKGTGKRVATMEIAAESWGQPWFLSQVRAFANKWPEKEVRKSAETILRLFQKSVPPPLPKNNIEINPNLMFDCNHEDLGCWQNDDLPF